LLKITLLTSPSLSPQNISGGCTVSLVRSSEIDNVIKRIDGEYHGATFYVCSPADGARAIDLGNAN
jgi:hypothetical protein